MNPHDTRHPRHPGFTSRPRALAVPGACLTAALLLLGTGCAPKYTDTQAFLRSPMPLVSEAEYRLAPPDVIVIRSKRVREIDNHTETIRPDGKITLPLIGSVFIAGKTCEESSAELELLAREYYQDADVSLRVSEYASKKILVFGEVSSPGQYAYDGTNTILDTLAAAQPTRLADPARIQVLRPGRDGKPTHRMTIDLNKMVRQGDTSLDAILLDGDILYIPPNPLARVGLAFQQLLLPIQPAASTVQGPGDIGKQATGKRYGRSD